MCQCTCVCGMNDLCTVQVVVNLVKQSGKEKVNYIISALLRIAL